MTELVELSPGKLFRLGGRVPMDGRITWLPPEATGYEPMNCYLLVEEDAGMLIDSGVGLHEDAIVEQVASVLPKNAPLTIFLTRMEPDCLTALGGILNNFRVEMVCAGGTNNPFDYFEDLNSSEMMQANYRAKLHRWLPGQLLTLSDDRTLDVIAPALRLLFTSWVYDRTTRTLFTSDAFSHTSVATLEEPAVVDAQTDELTAQELRSHLLTKFEYLNGAHTEPIIDRFRELFREHPIERVAPTHGCVLEGAETVQRHLDLLLDVLAEVSDPNAKTPHGVVEPAPSIR